MRVIGSLGVWVARRAARSSRKKSGQRGVGMRRRTFLGMIPLRLPSGASGRVAIALIAGAAVLLVVASAGAAPPIALNDTLVTTHDTSNSVAVLGNDIDPD